MPNTYTLTNTISDNYYNKKDKLFIESFNKILKESSLEELYQNIISILQDKNTVYTVTKNYYKDKQIVLEGNNCDKDYSCHCLKLYIPQKDKVLYFQRYPKEYNDNTKIIRLVDNMYHHSSYDIIFNIKTNEIIFYNTFDNHNTDNFKCLKFDEEQIIEDNISNNDRDYLIFILCVIYDYFWEFEE